MSVDYDAVGGIGILINSEIEDKLVIANKGEDYGGCIQEVLDDLNLTYEEAGDSSYTGDENTFYIMVEGVNLIEVNKNADILIHKLGKLGIEISPEDFVVVAELHIW